MEKAVMKHNPHQVWLRVINEENPFKRQSVLGVMLVLSRFMNWIAEEVPCGASFSNMRIKPSQEQIKAKSGYLGAEIAALKVFMISIAAEENRVIKAAMMKDFAPFSPLLTSRFGPGGEIVVDQTAKDDITLLHLAVRHGFFLQGLKGDRVIIKRCELVPDCGIFFVPTPHAGNQRYCCEKHRNRQHMREWRAEHPQGLQEDAANGSKEKEKEKTQTEVNNGSTREGS
jgi:hypothetical protein